MRRALLFIPLALCYVALSPALHAVTPAPDGGYPGGNTAEGTNALFSLTTGPWNTALGFQALYGNTTGNSNTAEGYHALFSNTTGSGNMAAGAQALFSNTTGAHNTAIGTNALYRNTVFGYNTAVGDGALYSNTMASANTANGFNALFSNTTGGANTANGYKALFRNTTGTNNTANGIAALYNNTGNDNTAVGARALLLCGGGSGNIALGSGAGDNLRFSDNNIFIGNEGDVFDSSNTIRIGTSQTRTFIAGIRGMTTGNTDAIPVVIDSAGQLGTMSSSRRFKKEIKPMDQTSQAILGLQPVTFQYKSDPTGTGQFGLIAEEVAKVDPDLVVRDAEGEIYSVRYEAVNAMLLNEFLKEHSTVQEQKATISQLKSTAAKQEATVTQLESTMAQQQKGMEALAATLKEQASQIQKVRAQLELSKTAPRTVVNN